MSTRNGSAVKVQPSLGNEYLVDINEFEILAIKA